MKKEFKTTLSAFLLWVYLLTATDVSALELEAPEEDPLEAREIRYLQWPTKESDRGETLQIRMGTSQVFRFDRVITRAAISNPEICDIIPLNTKEVLIYAKRAGDINLILWDETYRLAAFHLQSTLNLEKLAEILQKIDPTANLKIFPFKDSVAVYGTAETSAKVKLIEQTVESFDEKGLSFVKIKEPKQILLEVRFAEVDRRASKSFGLDHDFVARLFSYQDLSGLTGSTAQAVGGTSTLTPKDSLIKYLPLTAPTAAESAPLRFAYVDKFNAFTAYLNWLVQKNILKLIARPNLLAKDGEQASFVVGGESPYITSTQTSVNVAYKEFGTRLFFVPEVLDDGMIRLRVNTEVSELDFSTTVSLQGTTAPTIVKTTHGTVAELKDNESLVIGGLIFQRVNKVQKKFPILGDIPFVDRFFKREEFSRRDVELLIVVTPHLVKPFNLGEKKKFYPEKDISEAIQAFTPPYPDYQADLMNEIMTQEEARRIFDRMEKKKADQIAQEVQKIKEEERAAAFPVNYPTEAVEEATQSPSEEMPGNRGVFPGGAVPATDPT